MLGPSSCFCASIKKGVAFTAALAAIAAATETPRGKGSHDVRAHVAQAQSHGRP
jgi:hypothetical protein